MKGWGFHITDIDRSVRPQDDFYHYANGGWLKRHTIPPSESRWGTFLVLRYQTELRLKAILTTLLRRAPRTPVERMIRDFFRSGMDQKRRNKLDLAPLELTLERIGEVRDREELLSLLAKLHRMGIEAPFGFFVDQDAKNSEKYVLYLHQDGLGMPDRDYYLLKDPESVRVRSAYEPYVRKLFRLLGQSAKEAHKSAATVQSIELALAKASMDKVERREIEKTYHPKTLATLKRLAPAIDWKRYFALFGAPNPGKVIVMQPEFLKKVNDLFEHLPLEDWKTYLTFHLVNDLAGALSTRFVRHRFSFYGTCLSGVRKMKPRWRQVLMVLNGSLGQLLGKLYVEKHFPEEAKQKADQLVRDLFVVYEERIRDLDWMSEKTKRKALHKLSMMRPKIGYPTKWRSYAGLSVRPDDYLGNILRSIEFEHRRALKKLRKPVDREEWYSEPQVVNAFYNPSMNDMLFPAAILQPPFFDAKADDAVNYGAIGAVIGHEMTHGFDDEGSKFDGKGNHKQWWSPQDRKRFDRKGKLLVKQFDAYTVADGVAVNGKLTLGENIADLGGAAIAFDAYQRRLALTKRTDLDGFTPEQRFFLSFAKFECELIRPEFQKTLTLTDTHSPGIFRINGPLSNMTEFYEAFGVGQKDKLYRAPKDRAKIW